MTKTIIKHIPEFNIGELVRVIDADGVIARVVFNIHDFVGVQYKIVYWDGKQRKVEWVYPSELKKID